MKLINIGFGNTVSADKIRAVIIMSSNHIVLSAVQAETIAGRIDKDIEEE